MAKKNDTEQEFKIDFGDIAIPQVNLAALDIDDEDGEGILQSNGALRHHQKTNTLQ